MGANIDHEKRRDVILANSLNLFASQGYHGVTYQKIADRCGLTRTTLYKYFQNKREIFDAAILQVTGQIQSEYRKILLLDIPVPEQLERIMDVTVESLFRQRVLLTVILNYLLHLKQSGERVSRRITKHTYRVRRLFLILLMRGMERGEFRALDLAVADNLLYSQLESVIFQITVTERADCAAAKAEIHMLIDGLKS